MAKDSGKKEKEAEVPEEVRARVRERKGLLGKLGDVFSKLSPFPSRPKAEEGVGRDLTVESLTVQISGKPLDSYPVGQAEVFVYKKGGTGYYQVSEPPLSEREREVYQDLMQDFFYSLRLEAAKKPMEYVEGAIWDSAYELGLLDEVRKSFSKYLYYIKRNALGYGLIHAPMSDPKVEEISLAGPNEPVRVVHRDHTELGWLVTNIEFGSEMRLRRYNERLAQRLGESLTAAAPIVDAATDEGDRAALTFGREVTFPGSTFTIRKHPREPLTLPYLVGNNTLSSEMAAYLWQVLEWRGYLNVIGPIGSGKSIASGEPAMVLQDGVPKFESFSRLWGEAEGEDMVEAPSVRAKNPGVSVLSMEDEQCSWREADAFIELSHDGEGRRIVLKDGREVVTTPDHSLVVLDENGNLVERRPDEVGEEDMVPVLDRLELPSSPSLELSDLAKSLGEGSKDRIYVPRESVNLESENLPRRKKKIAEMMGYRSSGSLRSQKNLNFAAAEKAWKKTGFPERVSAKSQKHSTGRVVLPDALEREEFARLLGEYVADGHYDGRRCVVFGGDTERTAELVKSLGVEPIVVERENRVDRVEIPVVLTALIRGLGCGDAAGEKSLPEIYWRMDRGWRMQLLGSYLDRESHVSDRDVEVSTKSYELSRQLIIALLEANISARRSVKESGGNKHYRLTISHYFATELLGEIGLSVREKKKKLRKAVESRRGPWSKYHVVPWRLLKKNESEAKEVGWFLTQKLKKGWAVSKKKLRRVLKEKDPGRELKRLWSLAESNLAWMPIDRVEKCRISKKVYDFSVSPSETFLVGDGIFCHNTTLMNAVLGSVNPNTKRLTIEDTSEIRLPPENWQSMHTRTAHFAMGEEYEVDLFDLVRGAMRHRPDYLAVGESRGREMRTLTHAAALGHSCASTFHSDSPESALVRMRADPINLSDGEIILVWCFSLMKQIALPTGEVVRRVHTIKEVVPDEEGRPELREIFSYRPKSDSFKPNSFKAVVDRSRRLREAGELRGLSKKATAGKLKEKSEFLEGLVEKEETGFREYIEKVREFYS